MDPDAPRYSDDALTGARPCEWCHEVREDVRLRRLPDGDQPVLCGDCFRDAASATLKERGEP